MRKRSGTVVAVIAGLLALGMIIPMFMSKSNPGGEAAGITVAKVNRERVTALDVNREFTRLYYERAMFTGLRPEDFDGLRSEALDKLIDDALVLDAAKKADMASVQSLVDSEYNSERSTFDDENEWVNALARWGYSIKTYKQEIAKRQIIGAYPAVAYPYEVTEEEIQAEFDRTAKSNPGLTIDSARETIERALRYRKDKEARDKVIAAARETAKITILDPAILGHRAYVAGDYEESAKQYRRAAKQSPADAYVQVSLARAFIAMDKDKDAEAAFAKAEKLSQTDPYVRLAKGDMMKGKGDNEAAAAAYGSALKLADKDGYVLNQVLQGYKALGMDDRASEVQSMIEALRAEASKVETKVDDAEQAAETEANGEVPNPEE